MKTTARATPARRRPSTPWIADGPPLKMSDKGEPEFYPKCILFSGSYLSNWASSPFVVGDCTYNCVEQWMMAEKARMFGDRATWDRIMASPYPKSQKELGRAVAGYDDDRWAAKRFAIVARGVYEKFLQNPKLGAKLVATGDLPIAEASEWDDLWGIGVSSASPRARNPERWPGENLLGEAIMQARAKLQRASARGRAR
jgi:ribA/ribD-fused uncharacterized protein